MRLVQVAAYAAIIVAAASSQAFAAAAPSATGQIPVDDNVWHTYFVAARPIARAPAPADEYFGRYN
jgi:hypothetical protein